jgi:fumarate reductase flavoprotein subunit
VIVVGGGLAGWTAAVSAIEAGARVTLVERSSRRPGWGNSVISGGALHAVLRDPRDDPDSLAAQLLDESDGHADPAVVRAWAMNAARTVDWIEAHGAHLSRDPDHSHRRAVFAPVRETVPGVRHRGFGTANFLLALADRFEALGGRVMQPARAVGLHRNDSMWRVELRSDEGLDADAVVLADGGFQGSPVLLRKYVGTDQVKRRATGSSVGDGLRMGLSVGAAIVNMEGFYGHLLSRDSLTDDSLWPYPILDLVAAAGIVVGRDGRRIVDEADNGVGTTNAVAHSTDPAGHWIVVDDVAWKSAGRIGVTPPNPYLDERGASIVHAASLDELATRAGIDVAGLRASIDELAFTPQDAHPPRSTPVRIDTPPFHAIAVVAGVTFTFGGLRVDDCARVLDEHGRPIAGLFAAGGTMGGLHGGPRAGYGGGLLEAAVFGLLAGETAARAPQG